MLFVSPRGSTISGALLSSPIAASEDGAQLSGFPNFEFGIDPRLDPELAMVGFTIDNAIIQLEVILCRLSGFPSKKRRIIDKPAVHAVLRSSCSGSY